MDYKDEEHPPLPVGFADPASGIQRGNKTTCNIMINN
jgi:hypothetical protein